MFCKRILKVRSTTPNYMVYGELGRFPLEITIKIRMASFWRNLIYGDYGDKLSSCMYKLLFSLKQNWVYTFKWLNFIECLLWRDTVSAGRRHTNGYELCPSSSRIIFILI